MNISGIRPSEGFYSYNSIKLNELRCRQIMENKQTQQPSELTIDEQSESAHSRQTFSALDYAMEYNPDESFSLKGADSDIGLLDVEKAVSDFDKDQMLLQYQYFVGDSKHSGNQLLREKENFTL